MAMVVTGRLNKQIAFDIGISEITVKVHRGQVMRKMKAASLPDLAWIGKRAVIGEKSIVFDVVEVRLGGGTRFRHARHRPLR
jgi:Bacterial regulatory proteins, luxR family